MRLHAKRNITDHDMMAGVVEDSHHNRGISATVLVNSQAIASGAYALRVALGATNYRTFRAILRGANAVEIQGYDGLSVLAGGASEDCSAIGIAAYGLGYVTSYMGAYSRAHGDAYLSRVGMFGPGIALRDAYIDGTDAVFEFFNTAGVVRYLKVYGTLVVK